MLELHRVIPALPYTQGCQLHNQLDCCMGQYQSDFEYDWYKGSEDFNARAKLVTDDLSEYAFEYRYLDGERSLFTPSFMLFPNDDWSYGFYAQYDATLKEWRERKILVTHKFDCLGMGLGIKLDEDDVPMIWINFWLTAFPEMTPTVGR